MKHENQSTRGSLPSTTNRSIAELAVDLVRKGMLDSAVNLRALGAQPEAAKYWEDWRRDNPNTAVSLAIDALRAEA